MRDRYLRPAPDLGHAAEVAGGYHVGLQALDVLDFPPAQSLRHLRLQQIVGSGRATTEMALGHFVDVESGPLQQSHRLTNDSLPVLQRASRLVRNLKARRDD